MSKKSKRSEMIKVRDNLDTNQRLNRSNTVIHNLLNTSDYEKSENIFVFVSTKEEIYTHDFIKYSILNGKNIYIPYVDSEKKIMYATKLENFSDLEMGFYNILSVNENDLNIIEPSDLDLIIVPGLIFGRNLYRIGYGGGYYDKYLSQDINGTTVGVCFDFQVVDHVEGDPHDVPVDKIVTEHEIIERN